jgi:hypothetical protein
MHETFLNLLMHITERFRFTQLLGRLRRLNNVREDSLFNNARTKFLKVKAIRCFDWPFGLIETDISLKRIRRKSLIGY